MDYELMHTEKSSACKKKKKNEVVFLQTDLFCKVYLGRAVEVVRDTEIMLYEVKKTKDCLSLKR